MDGTAEDTGMIATLKAKMNQMLFGPSGVDEEAYQKAAAHAAEIYKQAQMNPTPQAMEAAQSALYALEPLAHRIDPNRAQKLIEPFVLPTRK